ncbi:dihydrolipoyl dehydrogenase family protein [Micromonospora sp. NBC_01796]|uniref:dihydrolipoyl dehydrogenase family protein n=1 Tax=Micromonospora sp. NBC_01796 TaxID=2975987 RepID=UPI002DD9965C|nr:NAD(P)/FAD-dependent oxidoreductase [Micromonospora sp. NBC_01796]WSA88813.1 NAD(P)/FAD-dependent oxidoreductase [Micromonospora sp. NBC_01796]
MTEPEQFDVIVMGLGVGGEEAAGRLAQAGLSVLGIERRLVGGECPYWGCIPSKMMIRAGNALAEANRVGVLGGRAEVVSDWAPVAARIRDEATTNWDDRRAADRFTGKGGRLVRGSAELVGPGLVEVDGIRYRARRGIVIGTGTTPVIPPVEGLAATPYWTNHEAIEAAELPRSIAVLGGGAIGLELAQVFARFGVRVHVVERSDRLLAMEEPESSELATAALRADGVEIHTGMRTERVDHGADGFTLHLTGDGTVRADRLLVASGRRARLDELGLPSVGLDPEQRYLDTDDRMRVADGIWAVGDVTGHGAFTHMAMYQAGIVIQDILSGGGSAPEVADRAVPRADYRALPRVTFTDPEIGAVGLTERQARDAGLRIRVGQTRLPDSSRGWIHKVGNEGFIKLIADAERGVLIGATSAGPSGGEVLGALAVAVHAAVPVSQLRQMIWAYPTFHRAIGDALNNLK